jgi:hypothetical protein
LGLPVIARLQQGRKNHGSSPIFSCWGCKSRGRSGVQSGIRLGGLAMGFGSGSDRCTGAGRGPVGRHVLSGKKGGRGRIFGLGGLGRCGSSVGQRWQCSGLGRVVAACPGAARRGAACHGTTRRGAACHGTARRGAACPGTARRGAACPRTARRGAACPRTARRGAACSRAGRPAGLVS